MLRVVKCTLHRHSRNFHCHYQKYRCRIHLLSYLRSNRHPILYHLATCILKKFLKIVLGTMLMVVVMVVIVVVGSRQARKTVTHWKRLSGNATDYKVFLKNNLNKADLIRRLNEFVKREIACLRLD